MHHQIAERVDKEEVAPSAANPSPLNSRSGVVERSLRTPMQVRVITPQLLYQSRRRRHEPAPTDAAHAGCPYSSRDGPGA